MFDIFFCFYVFPTGTFLCNIHSKGSRITLKNFVGESLLSNLNRYFQKGYLFPSTETVRIKINAAKFFCLCNILSDFRRVGMEVKGSGKINFISIFPQLGFLYDAGSHCIFVKFQLLVYTSISFTILMFLLRFKYKPAHSDCVKEGCKF